MVNRLRTRRALQGFLAALVVVFATLVTALAHYLPRRLVDSIATHSGRQIRIDGPFEAHLLALHPSLIAERVVVGNPPWSPAGTLATIGKLTVVFDLPSFSHPYAIRALEMDHADLHFQRDAAGHANWHWTAPGILPGKGLPVAHSLSLGATHLAIDDARRHISFDGAVTTQNTVGQNAVGENSALRIEARGHLNGREAILTLDGDPLATVARDKPYHFNFEERSSGSQLTGHGSVSRPFDFRVLELTFEGSGANLKDLHFLAGASLPNTGAYRLSGKLARHNTSFELSDLVATSGESDVHGTISARLDSEGRSHLEADLHSHRLRSADTGARVAGRATDSSQLKADSPQEKTQLPPDTPLRLDGLRRSDAIVHFHAQQLDVGPLSFHAVVAKLTTDHGVATVPSLSATLPDGQVSAHLELDARSDVPTGHLDVDVTNVQLGQFARKDPQHPPIDGLLEARLRLTGRGASVQELVASANGTLTAVLPHGVIRASLAELAGIDFRGLGLVLTRNKEETPVRCAVARFQAHDGTLTASTLVLDTEPVVITGSGSIQLASQALDLQLQGQPKELRLLRLRAPVAIHGTLEHPSFSVEKENRKLELVDPGHGKDVDCGALLAEAKVGGVQVSKAVGQMREASTPPAERGPSTR